MQDMVPQSFIHHELTELPPVSPPTGLIEDTSTTIPSSTQLYTTTPTTQSTDNYHQHNPLPEEKIDSTYIGNTGIDSVSTSSTMNTGTCLQQKHKQHYQDYQRKIVIKGIQLPTRLSTLRLQFCFWLWSQTGYRYKPGVEIRRVEPLKPKHHNYSLRFPTLIVTCRNQNDAQKLMARIQARNLTRIKVQPFLPTIKERQNCRFLANCLIGIKALGNTAHINWKGDEIIINKIPHTLRNGSLVPVASFNSLDTLK